MHLALQLMDKIHFYRPQRSWAKVIFLHVSVILLTGMVSGLVPGRGVSNFSGGGSPPIFQGGFQIFFSFFFLFFFFFSSFFSIFKKILLGCTTPETVNDRPVRILLECSLVKCQKFHIMVIINVKAYS